MNMTDRAQALYLAIYEKRFIHHLGTDGMSDRQAAEYAEAEASAAVLYVFDENGSAALEKMK